MKPKMLAITLIAAAIMLVAWPAGAQENVCYDRGGQWDMEQGKCLFQTGVMVNVTYPLELAGTGIAEQTVDAVINDLRTQFIQSYMPDYSLPSYANNWSLNLDYEIYNFSDAILTVKLNAYDYTGGAHGNMWIYTYTFDLAGQRGLTLADVFRDDVNPWPVIGPMVEADLMAHLGDMADPYTIQGGTGDNPDNYQAFALTPTSLIFFFPPYQVAAYAAGPQLSAVPLAAIRDLLRTPFDTAG